MPEGSLTQTLTSAATGTHAEVAAAATWRLRRVDDDGLGGVVGGRVVLRRYCAARLVPRRSSSGLIDGVQLAMDAAQDRAPPRPAGPDRSPGGTPCGSCASSSLEQTELGQLRLLRPAACRARSMPVTSRAAASSAVRLRLLVVRQQRGPVPSSSPSPASAGWAFASGPIAQPGVALVAGRSGHPRPPGPAPASARTGRSARSRNRSCSAEVAVLPWARLNSALPSSLITT